MQLPGREAAFSVGGGSDGRMRRDMLSERLLFFVRSAIKLYEISGKIRQFIVQYYIKGAPGVRHWGDGFGQWEEQ